MDINALRQIGCNISKASKLTQNKFILTKHPFLLNISEEMANAIEKIYKTCLHKFTIQELINIEELFKKFAEFADSEQIKTKLKNLSILKNLNKNILKELLKDCENNTQIGVLYNSPSTGNGIIEIIADEIKIRNGKLYIFGYNFKHKKQGFLNLSKIKEIAFRKLKKDNYDKKIMFVQYKLNKTPQLEQNEKIIDMDGDNYIIEIQSNNEFLIKQRILSLGADCTVIQPKEFKDEIINTLKDIRKLYD